MRALLFGLALLVMASAGPVSAWQPSEEPPAEETEPTEPTEDGGGEGWGEGPRTPRPGEDGPRTVRPGKDMAGKVCKTSVKELKDAKEYCEGQLNCASQGLTVHCSGGPNNWNCRCR